MTVVSLPFRIGVNTERRGSALCLIDWTCQLHQYIFLSIAGFLCHKHQGHCPRLKPPNFCPCAQHIDADATRTRSRALVLVGRTQLHRWTSMRFSPLFKSNSSVGARIKGGAERHSNCRGPHRHTSLFRCVDLQ